METAQAALLGTLGIAVAAAGYHHVAFPALLRRLARRSRASHPAAPGRWPTISIVMPAYREERHIERKLRALRALPYVSAGVEVLVGCDGSPDGTEATARRVAAEGVGHPIAVHGFAANRGKVAVLNDLLPLCRGEIVVLTDVSAEVPLETLMRLARWFADPRIGVVAAAYDLSPTAATPAEQSYWRWQRRNKRGEAALGAPMGAHGSLYAMRSVCVRPLPADTINDDFLLPMAAVAAGWLAVYDDDLVASEREPSPLGTDLRRRVRIGAGNLQQLLRLPALLSPARPGVALAFASGKALRALMPFVLAIGAAALGGLAVTAGAIGDMARLAALGIAAAGGLMACRDAILPRAVARPVRLLRYALLGYAASGWGALRYLAGSYDKGWRRGGPASVLPAPTAT
ncbi:MAG: glycosyltransferase [Alphaproteobacteria bacterium]|nr:glycosyltransferase [Alphaproteobacteria bacterium]